VSLAAPKVGALKMRRPAAILVFQVSMTSRASAISTWRASCWRRRTRTRLLAFQLASIDAHTGIVLPAATRRYSERLLFSGLLRTGGQIEVRLSG
jgi:hypothetical protein